MKSTGTGSSPRTWGTQSPQLRDRRIFRFIPTHVGNATAYAVMYGVVTVYPHARGERHFLRLSDHDCTGSSPRTWGTLAHAHWHVAAHRFIPTHVGNALAIACWNAAITVHPHARGERPN